MMLATKFARQGVRLAAGLALLVVAASCKKDSTEPAVEEPSTTAIRLTFGTASPVTYTGASGEVRSVHVPVGATTVTAQWLRADGTVDPVATTQNFTLRVIPSSSAITYAPAGANSFTGTLNASAVTNLGVTFALFHVAEGHEDFGPITVNISAP
jgi:hypothetical protein